MRRFYHIFATLLLNVGLWSCSGSAHHDHGETEGHEGHSHGEGHAEESMDVELSQAQMDAVGITLGGIEQRELGEALSANGVLEVGAQHESAVAPALGGTVSKICVNKGDRVKRGQVVAYVESPELLSLRQEYAVAKKEVEMAAMEYQRQETLASHGAGIRKNLENARADLSLAELKAKNCLARITSYGGSPEGNNGTMAVKAEISGVVSAVDLQIGSFADSQTPVVKIVDTDAVYCSLGIVEKDINRLSAGLEVEMRLTNDPSVTFTGKILEITPILNPETRTIPVRVSVAGDKSAMKLMPGMAVSALVSLGGEKTDVLPEEAIVSAGGKSYIFVLEDVHEEEGGKTYHFEKREVVRGTSAAGFTAVTPLEPLEEDAQIVVSGAFYLNSMSSDHGEHNH